MGIILGAILAALLVGRILGPEAYDGVVTFLSALGLVLLGITLLVTIHELGHFLTAKWFGMRVEAFSIGFPPKLFSLKRGETDYQIGATPLGGYVKISGIIDESMDTQHIEDEPEPWEFRAKPVWQRLIVMTGGVIMNVLLGIFIFSMLSFAFGDRLTPMDEVKNGIAVKQRVKMPNKCGDIVEKTTLGYYLGFRTGDKLLSYKGESLPYFEDYNSPALLIEDEAYFEVDRKGEKVRIDVPPKVLDRFSDDSIEVYLFSMENFPAQVLLISDDTSGTGLPDRTWPAEKAGMLSGDRVTQIDGTPIAYYEDLLNTIPFLEKDLVQVTVQRGDSLVELNLELDSTRMMGIRPFPEAMPKINTVTQKYGFWESFPQGLDNALSVLSLNAKGFSKIIQGNASAGNSVMGPLAIAKVYLERFKRFGWSGFWELTASLSMILALVNILPIPALDGGHVVFLLIEAITRKEPSPKVRIIAQQIGMFLLLGLMVLVIFNDTFTHLLSGC